MKYHRFYVNNQLIWIIEFKKREYCMLTDVLESKIIGFDYTIKEVDKK
jgi:hypothetical protein